VTSFGEGDITVNGIHVGKVRIQSVYQGQALFPRLTVRLGVVLLETPTRGLGPGRPLENFELRGVDGELRLDQHSKALGSLHLTGAQRSVQSSAQAFETQLEVACDLDWQRLEMLEEHRAGREPVLWIALWASLVDQKGAVDTRIDPIQTIVPRDRWLEFLGAQSGRRATLLEVTHPGGEAKQFKAAIGHVHDARARIDRGDFDEAVASCRRAIESIHSALDVPRKPNALEAAIASVTDVKRAKAYSGIVSRLKELGNFTIHRSEAPGRYSRGEAQFVVAATEYSLALLAGLLWKRLHPPET
jgi:ABC-type Fe3+/spermidine/putrescine transport system ATPase subunit